ncbi:hypothetical protein [Rhodanobacter ginsengiterrae]|uniref:hypothetical protein n=1 Tax=Rhodanobacter ginsengiterrae TaxID=2008451 RepID=UPI003CF39E8C
MPLTAAALDRVLGTYAAGDMKMKVFVEGKQLQAQMGGQPPVEIFAETPNLFFMTAVDATLAFAPGAGKPGAGKPGTVTLSEGGHAMALRRLP